MKSTSNSLFPFVCGSQKAARSFCNAAAECLQRILSNEVKAPSESQVALAQRLSNRAFRRELVAIAWGHASWDEVVECARKNETKRVVVCSDRDEGLSGADLHRRRLEQVEKLTLFLSQLTGPESSTCLWSQNEVQALVARWQPTARDPSIDVVKAVFQRENPSSEEAREAHDHVRTIVDRILQSRSEGRVPHLTNEEKVFLSTAVSSSTDVKDQVLRCDIAIAATYLLNSLGDDLGVVGEEILERLVAQNDPYACIQVAVYLERATGAKRDHKRALDLACKAIKNKDELILKQSLADAHEVAGMVLGCGDISYQDPSQALQHFIEGANLGGIRCAFKASILLLGERPEGQNKPALPPDAEKAMHFLRRVIELTPASPSKDEEALCTSSKEHILYLERLQELVELLNASTRQEAEMRAQEVSK